MGNPNIEKSARSKEEETKCKVGVWKAWLCHETDHLDGRKDFILK